VQRFFSLAKTLLALTVVTTLIGCTTVDVSPTDARQATARQLGIDASAIVQQAPARFAQATPGARYANFQFGLYTQTATDIVLFTYSAQSKSFAPVTTIPIKRIQFVAIESWGAFNHAKQLQVVHDGVLLAVNFNNSSDALAGPIEATKPPFDSLVAAGAREGVPNGRVLPSEVRNMVVPLPMPAR
jgi:hypothetical protein